MTVIRRFAESDRAALLDLFVRARESSPSGALWGHSDSEAAVYLTPYMDLEPDSVFLAEADGQLVGYLTGSVGGSRLPSEGQRTEDAIRDYRLMLRPRCLGFFLRVAADTLFANVQSLEMAADFADPRWPAHLNMNVLPEARGTGAAYGLMNRWLGYLREQGIPGCHLKTLTENTRAVAFFERFGFTGHGPELLVPGIRYDGHRVHQLTMVWAPRVRD